MKNGNSMVRSFVLTALWLVACLLSSSAIYAQNCVVPPSGLVSWWPLDETSGTTAADITGTNSGTHFNGPTPAAGKVAGALSFDGVNDFVQIPDSPSFDFTDWTVDAWIQTSGAGSSFRRIIWFLEHFSETQQIQ